MRHILFLFILIPILSYGQGITWNASSWEEVIALAREENKLIFIDTYTNWCRPCLQMDQDVFPEKTVGEIYNKSFISFKINAEDSSYGSEIAKEYGVHAYPGLFFLDWEGRLISSFVGYHNKFELVDIAQQTMDLYDQFDFLLQVKNNIGGAYSTEELENILSVSKIHSFEGKEILAMRYLDDKEIITEIDLRLVMGEIAKMDIDHVQRLAPLTSSLSYEEIYLRRNSKEWITWKTETEKAMQSLLARFKQQNNLPGFEKSLEILKSMPGIKTRQVDNQYLDFYKQNDLDQYRTFATYLIDEYIIPARPEAVKTADEEKYKILHEEIMKDLRTAGDATVGIITEEATQTPMLDSLTRIYTISEGIADRLYEISSDFYAFFDDDSSRRKAAFWASLAHLYYPYAWKYFDNHIFILEATGKIDEAQKVRKNAKLLPWYKEMTSINSF